MVATKLTETSTDLVLDAPFNLMIPHVIQTSLLTKNTQCFSASRLTLYKILHAHIYVFLSIDVSLKDCSPITPIFFPFPEEGKKSHLSCIYSRVFLASLWSPCLTLSHNPDLELFINRAYLRIKERGYQAQYVTATHSDSLKYYSFLEAKSV